MKTRVALKQKRKQIIYIFNFSPIYFVLKYKKLILVKIAHEFSLLSHAPKGIKIAK